MATAPMRRLSVRMAVTAALAVGGCVSAADEPSPTEPHRTTTTLPPTTTTMLDLESRLDDFRRCLDDRGLTIDEIAIDGRGRPRLALALSGLRLTEQIDVEAVARCAPILATGALDTGSDPEMARRVREALLDYADCMRRSGVVSFPDPTPDYDAVGPPFDPAAVPWQDGRLGTAVTVCSALLARSSS